MHLIRLLFSPKHSNVMDVLSHYLVRYFCSFILVFLLSQVAICIENSNDMNQTSKSPSFVDVPTKTSKEVPVTGGNETRQLQIESITKVSSDSSLRDHSEKTTSKPILSHDHIPNNTGLPEHSTNSTITSKPTNATTSNTVSSVIKSSSSTGTANNESSMSTIHPTLVTPTIPSHRKSKPEETHVDDILQDSGPTTDYVVPLVVAMLAVPLVGVLCALLYMKGRDFWERRHYGRIDFLWDSRSDSRMDFLIDGMYRE